MRDHPYVIHNTKEQLTDNIIHNDGATPVGRGIPGRYHLWTHVPKTDRAAHPPTTENCPHIQRTEARVGIDGGSIPGWGRGNELGSRTFRTIGPRSRFDELFGTADCRTAVAPRCRWKCRRNSRGWIAFGGNSRSIF